MPPSIRGKKEFVKKSEASRREKAVVAMAAINERKVARKKSAEKPVVVSSCRRLIELPLFASSLWCESCNDVLSLRFMEKQKQRGLASLLYLRCHRCPDRMVISTSSTVKNADGSEIVGQPTYSVNLKSAFGYLDTGLAHEQLNKFLSALNVPTVDRKTLKRAEVKVAPSVLATAKDLCRQAIEEERILTANAARSPQEIVL